MSGDLVPRPPQTRMSDADREQVAQRLRAAHGEGRLTLEEFDERLGGVFASRTFGEADQYVADLPGSPISAAALEHAELRTTAATLKRRGRWVVPRHLVVTAKVGTVKLDFTEAHITHPVIYIDLDVYAGSTILVLPPGSSADLDNVEFVAGQSRMRDVTATAFAGEGLHVVVRGKQRAGTLVVRTRRRFLRWRW
ncbi:DUF1707 SHOCT-like domain-containing protein [Sphaerisporangium aureirubrum]|uniref:DUF1707 domain-containing protein n=1 Tax=Sphaerisporangium aureirubrum TaxID=1544736 RepID=A0ABW1NAJ6_9ACTN